MIPDQGGSTVFVQTYTQKLKKAPGDLNGAPGVQSSWKKAAGKRKKNGKQTIEQPPMRRDECIFSIIYTHEAAVTIQLQLARTPHTTTVRI